jgi:hypothetical protein
VLERRWRVRLDIQQKESARKAAAAAAAATGHRTGYLYDAAVGLERGEGLGGCDSAVTTTAAWLDQANSVLNEQEELVSQHQSLTTVPKNQLVSQMERVERLIYEGPRIQRSSADLTLLLDQASDDRPSSPGSGADLEPADKRMRTGSEDAEALVGFLRSVRKSAIAQQDSRSVDISDSVV